MLAKTAASSPERVHTPGPAQQPRHCHNWSRSTEKAMRTTADCQRCSAAQDVFIEIVGSGDGRYSTSADLHGRLTFLAPAPTFQPKCEPFIFDHTGGRLVSRHSSAPSVGTPQETCFTPGHLGPRVCLKPAASTASFSSLSFEETFKLHGYNFTKDLVKIMHQRAR